jgi:hypothetical protein
VNRHVRSLLALARRYWRAEAAVVRAYFKRPRSREEHARWLKAQAYKEYSAIRPLLETLLDLAPRMGAKAERRACEELAEKLRDEIGHARLILDLLDDLCGRRVEVRELPWLPEDQRLARVRARYSKATAALLHGSGRIGSREIVREDERLERAAITLTEGGGAALYEVCARLERNDTEKKIAAVFRRIRADELRHQNAGAAELRDLVRTAADYRRAARIVKAVLSQRLRMRNEQFGFPLSRSELSRLEERARAGRTAAFSGAGRPASRAFRTSGTP